MRRSRCIANCKHTGRHAALLLLLPLLLLLLLVSQPSARPGGGMFGGRMPEIHQVPAGGIRKPTPSGWAEGLSREKAAEWLVDCYRMRVDDDYAWGGTPLITVQLAGQAPGAH